MKKLFFLIMGGSCVVMIHAFSVKHAAEQKVHEVSTVTQAEEVDNVAAEQAALASRVTTKQITAPGTTAQIAQEELVATENELCADGASCSGDQTANLQTGAITEDVHQGGDPITEEAIKFKQYKTYIAMYQRIDDGTWKQIGFLANKTIPVEKMGNNGTLEVTVLPDGRAEVLRGGHRVMLDFTKEVK